MVVLLAFLEFDSGFGVFFVVVGGFSLFFDSGFVSSS